MNYEKDIDNELHIETCEFDDSKEDYNHRAYEPTPYNVLDLLIESEFISENDFVVDMGCGKGRVGFYLADKVGCSVKGIEFDPDIYEKACENLASYIEHKLDNMAEHTNGDEQDITIKTDEINAKISFQNISAEKYEIDDKENVFFFFNPFSVKILSKVLSNIENSFYNCNRDIKLIFYYPTLEYVGELMAHDMLDFVDEIDCSHLYKDSKGRECIMIFELV